VAPSNEGFREWCLVPFTGTGTSGVLSAPWWGGVTSDREPGRLYSLVNKESFVSWHTQSVDTGSLTWYYAKPDRQLGFNVESAK
jgi:hypothetical protein